MSRPVLVVLCTFPGVEVARRICRLLVEERLVACANLVPSVESIYRWQGDVQTETETLVLLKTTHVVYPALESRLQELHPYDVPEIVAVSLDRIAATFGQWVENSVSTH